MKAPSSSPRPSSRRRAGFTLLELLVVLAIIAILLSILVPSFRGASPRQAAVITLKSALEAARAVAIRDQTEVYIAFTDDLPSEAEDKYSHFAVFKRIKKNRSGTDTGTTYDLYFSNQFEDLGEAIELHEIRPWTRLPDGTVFALAGPGHEHVEGLRLTVLEGNYASSDPGAELQSEYERQFPVPPRFGAPGNLAKLPFLMFNREGRLGYPQFFEPERHYLAIMEGSIDDSGSHFARGEMLVPGGSKPNSEAIGINLYSGRVRIISQNR